MALLNSRVVRISTASMVTGLLIGAVGGAFRLLLIKADNLRDDPRRVEIIEVASQSKTAASPFEGLGLRRSHRVILVGPLLAGPRVRSEPVDGHLARHKDLAGDDFGVALDTRDVIHRDRLVVARPALRADQRIQTVGVST